MRPKPVRLNATEVAPDDFMIGFGAIIGDCTLSASGSLTEAASRLSFLPARGLRSEKPRIAVAPIPDEGIGIAINDRLRRAATHARLALRFDRDGRDDLLHLGINVARFVAGAAAAVGAIVHLPVIVALKLCEPLFSLADFAPAVLVRFGRLVVARSTPLLTTFTGAVTTS